MAAAGIVVALLAVIWHQGLDDIDRFIILFAIASLLLVVGFREELAAGFMAAVCFFVHISLRILVLGDIMKEPEDIGGRARQHHDVGARDRLFLRVQRLRSRAR